jgi:ATP-dependent Lon protease
VNIDTAKRILDEDHYGLEKIKERIIEYLAVTKLKNRLNKEQSFHFTNILCFAGPPGVGKTSIGRSIARTLNRQFVSISLGGIKDEAEIKGHRRTYIGALPGRIIQSMRQAGTKNPVFMMDEIDKISSSFLGNPAAALLEVLDPEQNYKFSDNYLEVPFDLSQVFFITTCNILDTIPPALKDRLEVIDFSGYTEVEKFHIAKNFLIKKQLDANGLDSTQVDITDHAINRIIERYTREAGVRNLEREIAKIFRKVARKILEGSKEKIVIKPGVLKEYLGVEKYKPYLAEKTQMIGIAPALAWSEAGGVVLSIEVALMPGKGNLILTGQLGDVMKESCKAALSYIRSRAKELGLDKDFHKYYDIHIHVPEGAVPKDGPSAGIAIVTALVSALSDKPIRNDLGMTGEITLRGRVLPVGGIKEKVIAAQRAGLAKVILPEDNRKDIEEIPIEITRKLEIDHVKEIEEALKIASDLDQ